MKLEDIYFICDNDINLLAFLQHSSLILNEKICEQCQISCYISKRGSHFVFRCPKCLKRFTSSPSNYFFYKARLSYDAALKLMYFFINGITCAQATHMLGISKKTAVDWYNFCREVCFIDILSYTRKIGGPGKFVEIDEALYSKNFYYKGRNIKGNWVVGGIESGSYSCFLVPVENRNSETLSSILAQYIEPGTTVITDEWEGYKELSKLNFKHLTVNHFHNFVDPTFHAHTSTAEGTWSKIKSEIRACGRPRAHFHSYLSAYLWIKNNTDEIFEKFLETIAKHYH